MIVEDEAIIAADLARKLKRLGYTVAGAVARGEDAQVLAQQLRPHLILMDIRLAGAMDGIQAADAIRRKCDLPVIFLTAHSDDATLQRAKLTNPFGYIIKPFDERDLHSHIEMAIHKHQAEQKLRASEERLRVASESARVGMWSADIPSGTWDFAPQAARLFGLPDDGPVPFERILELTHPEDRERLSEQSALALAEAGEHEFEYRIIRPDGELRWMLLRGRTDLDVAGRPWRNMGVVMDITGRKQAEETIRKTSAELQSANAKLRDARYAALNLRDDAIQARKRAEWLARFPEENPSPVLRVATDGTVLYRNPAAAERRGWTCEAGQPAPDVLRALVDRAVTERQGSVNDVEMEGSIYAITVALFPEERYANLYGRDVTDERRVQKDIEIAKREWERTFDSVPDLISILDHDHRIVRVNRAMAEHIGKKPAECIGLPCYEIVHGCSSPISNCPHRRTLADGRDYVAEVREERLNGEYRVSTSAIRDEQGHIIATVHMARNVTEQKRAERREQEALALATASRSAMDILESMGEGVLLLDMEGRILSVNPASARMTGIPAREQVGRLARDLLPELIAPGEQALVAAALAEPLEGRIPKLPAFTLLKRGGDRIPVVPSITFVRGSGNDPSAIVITLRDLSELRSLEKSLEESHALLERIFDNTHMAIVYLDRDFNFVRVNQAYADGCGREPDFFPGKNHFALYPHAENEAIFRSVVETGEMFATHEKPFEFPDHPEWGVTYWDWTLRPLKGEQNQVESLLFCLLDVTARVRARQSLVESERKYRELVQNANSIIMRVTPDHDITFFNEYAQQFFGYAEDEVLGKNVVGTIVPETNSAGHDMRAMLKEITMHPERHGSNENENMRKDGQRVWVHWANRAVRDDKGNLIEMFCVGTDITQRREMEAEALRYQQRLRELAERLAASEEEDRWRISRYIHDTIIQNLSLARLRLGSLEKPMSVAQMHEEIESMRQVRGLLEKACDECRMVMADLTPALLYELGLVAALNDLAEQLKTKHGARVSIEGGGCERSLTNPLRGLLFESARELIMNALKYAGPCAIRVVMDAQATGLTLRVSDNGLGFDPSTAGSTPDHSGGFGLFSIRQRLEGLGGRIDIESAPGKGTTATITVPTL